MYALMAGIAVREKIIGEPVKVTFGLRVYALLMQGFDRLSCS